MKKILSIVAFCFLSFSAVFSQTNPTDSLALVDLYNSTGGASWTTKTNWLSGKVNTWYGVKTAAGRVTSLDLRANNLNGTLPASMANLTSLYTLILKDNSLTGSLPSAIGNLVSLQRLVLSGNTLSGSLPASITSLTNLYEFNIVGNSFSGSLPSDIGSMSALRFAWLNGNSFDGSIPSSIMSLSNLEALALNDNNLSGSIPSGFGGIPNCREIYMGGNNLSGSIPSDINGATALQQLWLDDNALSGPVPGTILGLTNLLYLGLSNNELTGNIHDFSGSMPNLQWIFLNGNNFDKISGMSSSASLSFVDVSDNQLKFFQLQNATSPPTEFYYIPQDSIGTTTDTTISLGGNLAISVSDVTTGNSYEWYKDGVQQDEVSSQFNITSATYDDEGEYYCYITNSNYPGLTLIQRVVTVSIACTPPSITTQPASIVITENYNTTFTVVADYATAYQWQVNTGSGFTNVTDGTNYSGSTTSVLTVISTPMSFNGYTYRCTVTGGCTPDATTSVVTLTVSLPISTYTKYVQDAVYGLQRLNVTTPPTTANKVYIKPNFVSGASYYTIQISTVSDFSSNTSEKTGTTGIDWGFLSLTGSTTYYCRVKVNGGAYGVSKQFVVEPSPIPPGTCVLGKTYDVTYGWQSGSINPTTAVNVYCRPTPVSGATQWTVEVNTDPNFGTGTAITRVGTSWSTLSFYYFSGLTPNTTYYVRARVDNESNWGDTRTIVTNSGLLRGAGSEEDVLLEDTRFDDAQWISAQVAEITTEETLNEVGINTYPNPFNTDFQLDVRTSTPEKMTVTVLDMSGRMVQFYEGTTNTTARLGAELSAGMYALQIHYGNTVEQRKIIKK